MYGANISYLFGNKLKESGVLDSIKTADGHVINQNGIYAEVRLFERGFTGALNFGRLFNIWNRNPNSGIFFMAGAGFIQHKIKIDDIGNASPQLSKEMKKGYDRLTNGFAVTESIGYLFLGNKKTINFFGCIDVMQGFTEGRREWDYDLMRSDSGKRFDLLYGIRFGWILPLYKRTPDLYYYY